MKKLMCIIIAASICFMFGACSKSEPVSAPVSDTVGGEAYFYIGRGEDYRKIGVGYEGELTEDMLIEKMAKVTGWNLALSGSVILENNSMSVDFSKESSAYTGADNGNESFKIENKDNLICTILDSVAYSLKNNFGEELEIYYSCEGEEIEVNGKKISTQEAYSASAANKYTDEQAEEFLVNRLSGYYDTPDTSYVKYDEVFEDGELYYIYRAVEKKSETLLGVYKFPVSLNELYEEIANGDYELIWSMN